MPRFFGLESIDLAGSVPTAASAEEVAGCGESTPAIAGELLRLRTIERAAGKLLV